MSMLIPNTAVMLSIQPKWCALTASGKKTIEIRKTKPKISPPFKCYIYCTKGKERFVQGGMVHGLDDLYRMPSGEIRHGYSEELICCGEKYTKDNFLNGKVIGEFLCDKIIDFGNLSTDKWQFLCGDVHEWHKRLIMEKACLSEKEFLAYGGRYGWHISDLMIYDKPKELGEFYTKCQGTGSDKDKFCRNCPHLCFDHDPIMGYCRWCSVYNKKPVTRPPQSWCYVKEEKK